MLVEDEPLVKNLVSEVLRKSGYQVMEFVNGREALARAKRHGGLIHLLVTDVVMPGMSGIELARQLALGRPEMRVLFISGYTDDLVERQGVLQPGRAFLQKPFTPDTLLRKVRELLDAPLGDRGRADERPPCRTPGAESRAGRAAILAATRAPAPRRGARSFPRRVVAQCAA